MLQDGQPSTRQLLNSSQTVTASYILDAFGNSVGGSGSSANPFIWNGGSGYCSDSESGLQKVGARIYDPAVGRWISQDTLLVAGSAADSQAVDRYAYCEANPIGRWDPLGHDASSDCDQAWQRGLDMVYLGEDIMHRIDSLASNNQISQADFVFFYQVAEEDEALGHADMAAAHERKEALAIDALEESAHQSYEKTLQTQEAFDRVLEQLSQQAEEDQRREDDQNGH